MSESAKIKALKGEHMKTPSSQRRVQAVSLLLILIISIIMISYALESSLTIPSSGSIYYQPEFQILFNDGFETGDFNAWNGTKTTTGDQATTATTNPYEGAYHAIYQTGAITSGTRYAYSYVVLSTPVSEIYARAYFHIFDGLPLDDNEDRFGLIAFEVNGQLQCTFRVYRLGGVDKFNIIGFNGTASVQKSTDAIYPEEGKWYCIEFYVKVHSTKGEYRAWINGVEQITVTNVDTTLYGSGVNRIRFGLTSTINVQHAVTVYCDSVVVSTRYIGPMEAQVLFKDGFESGDFNEWSGVKTTINDQATVTTTNPYHGTFNAQYQTSAISSGTKYAYSYLALTKVVTEVYVRAYFYIADGLPLDDNDDRFGLIAFEVNGQLQSTFRVHRSGDVDRFDIIGLNGTSTVQKSTDAIYPAEGQWYCIEFYIKVHSVKGEYRAWINGVEQISITNVDTTRYGWGVTCIRIGLTSTINVQHTVTVKCDVAAVSTNYIGEFYEFAVIGSQDENPAIANFYWLFGNQSIRYKALMPSEVKDSIDIDLFEGLVVWTKNGGYNAEAVKKFAQKHIVISHMWDFCNMLYPSLNSSTQIVTTNTVTYVKDWGNFRNGDLVEMRNETGDTNKLTTVLASALASFSNTTTIAQYDSDRIALFQMNGTKPKSGFYVMDLDATTPETEWTGIWHVFPAVKMVSDFPTGKYARWMANGQKWWDLSWIYNSTDTIVNQNKDIAEKKIIGYSVENREIPAIFIGNGTKYAIIDGAIHGNEKTGPFACLRVAELLIQYYRTDPYWKSRLSEYTVIIIPVLNPDGFAKNTRENANGKDLNSQFPPDGTPTEPEAWALINLMGNYTPTVYINIHEGYYWYPLDMLYGNYESGTNKTLTINAMTAANNTFTELHHYGWFTENNSTVWIGKVRSIYQGGKKGMAVSYASYQYKASCMLLETFVWSSTWGARKSLWGLDYYPAVILSFLQNIQR
jgi:hypothetical protein